MTNDSTQTAYLITFNEDGKVAGLFIAADEDAALDAYARQEDHESFDAMLAATGAEPEDFEIEAGEGVATRWRERVWGRSPEGDEHVVIHDGEAYLVTEGTGDGSYAYDLGDVAQWLATDNGPSADAWGDHVRSEDDPDFSQAPYQRFCDACSPVSDEDVAIAVWRAIRVALCDGGAEILSEEDLAAACADEDEVPRLVAVELGIDPERVTASRDVDAHGHDYWTAEVEGHVDEDAVEIADGGGTVTVQVRGEAGPNHYALIANRGAGRAEALDGWTDPRDAGDPALIADAQRRVEARGGFSMVTWVSVDGPCAAGDMLDVSEDGDATVQARS